MVLALAENGPKWLPTMKTTQIQRKFFAQFRPIIWPFDGYYVIFAQTYYIANRTCNMYQPKI